MPVSKMFMYSIHPTEILINQCFDVQLKKLRMELQSYFGMKLTFSKITFNLYLAMQFELLRIKKVQRVEFLFTPFQLKTGQRCFN